MVLCGTAQLEESALSLECFSVGRSAWHLYLTMNYQGGGISRRTLKLSHTRPATLEKQNGPDPACWLWRLVRLRVHGLESSGKPQCLQLLVCQRKCHFPGTA